MHKHKNYSLGCILQKHTSQTGLAKEERRLFYVALTRAREELLLSHCRMRFRTGAPGPTTPSRFLEELPDDVLPDFGSTFAKPSLKQRQTFGAEEDVSCLPDFAQPKRGNFNSTVAQVVPDADEAEGLVVGDFVTHPVFGDGTITRIQGKGINARVVVEFDETGEERTLLLSYSMLEKLT